MKILVVDDSAANRKLLRITLETEGVDIGEAGDGFTALELLNRESFDAVISDILMPRMDGYRLFHEIRRDVRWRNLPIIAYTSTYLSPGDEQLALRSGADRYLSKPAPVALLLRTLNDLLQAGTVRHSEMPGADDPQVMHEYNIVLVRKLEAKSAELKERNAALGMANRELAESRARFEGIIASAMDAIITVNETDGIVLFNTAAEAMFGATCAAMLGQPLANLLTGLFGPEDPADFAGFKRSQTTGRRMGLFNAISGRRANGVEFPVEASFSFTEVAGQLLFTVILRDISERKRSEEQLRIVTGQLRALAARSENIRERERTAVAREIHDVLAQELTCLKIDLIWIAKSAASSGTDPLRMATSARIVDAIAQTDAAIVTVQRIATDLRPVILDSLGLPAAIEWQVEDFARRSGMNFRVQAPRGDSMLSRDCATAVFRILQESLTNVARHARATQIDVQFTEESDFATLAIVDNGCGITTGQIADVRSIGLVGMRERTEAFGGTIAITGAPDPGTTVRVRIPIDQKNRIIRHD